MRRQVTEATTRIGRRMTGCFSIFAVADGTIRIISLQQPLPQVDRRWVWRLLAQQQPFGRKAVFPARIRFPRGWLFSFECLDGFRVCKMFEQVEKIGDQNTDQEKGNKENGIGQKRRLIIKKAQVDHQAAFGHEKFFVLKNDQPDKAEDDDPEGDFHLFHCVFLLHLVSVVGLVKRPAGVW
jgi:hypothetical protein